LGRLGTSPRDPLDRSVLDRLANRGPDAAGWRAGTAPGCSWELGHTRLSIVDLSEAGEQPMENEDGTLLMVFNGEIYNSPELRRLCEAHGHRFRSTMDGEVILHLWEMEGVEALNRLNGIFAVAVLDTRTGEIVLARDPLGVKPLVYCVAGGGLWFASELAALQATGAPLGSHDLTALAQFLAFLWVPDPRTPFAGARTLEPGQALRWSNGQVRLLAYGAPLVPEVDGDRNASDDVDELARRLREAADRQLLADVPIGLMASGGVDSGLLWWATEHSLARAYTIGWPAADDVEGLDEDRQAVVELERRFATPVDHLRGEAAQDTLPPSGDLFADPAYGLTRLIAGTAADQGYKVLLSGQGGDELFAGYRRHTVAPVIGRLRLGSAGRVLERSLLRLPGSRLSTEYLARMARAAAETDPFRAYMQLATYSGPAERARALDCTEAEVSNDVVWQRHREVYDRLPPGLSFLRRAMALDLAVYLPGLGLAYVDRAGMEFGVEIRVPWLDLELVRWTLRLPPESLVRRGRGKWLPRELAARELSAAMAHRPKRGFAAPASSVSRPGGRPGDRGFRQGAYFERARRILDRYLAVPLGSGGVVPDRVA
jgi:asparagine synthase (glutamine-hydrolysing)